MFWSVFRSILSVLVRNLTFAYVKKFGVKIPKNVFPWTVRKCDFFYLRLLKIFGEIKFKEIRLHSSNDIRKMSDQYFLFLLNIFPVLNLHRRQINEERKAVQSSVCSLVNKDLAIWIWGDRKIIGHALLPFPYLRLSGWKAISLYDPEPSRAYYRWDVCWLLYS